MPIISFPIGDLDGMLQNYCLFLDMCVCMCVFIHVFLSYKRLGERTDNRDTDIQA